MEVFVGGYSLTAYHLIGIEVSDHGDRIFWQTLLAKMFEESSNQIVNHPLATQLNVTVEKWATVQRLFDEYGEDFCYYQEFEKELPLDDYKWAHGLTFACSGDFRFGNYTYYLGVSYNDMQDHETKTQFKERVQNLLKKYGFTEEVKDLLFASHG